MPTYREYCLLCLRRADASLGPQYIYLRVRLKRPVLPIQTAAAIASISALSLLSGCAAFTSTTNTAAEAAQTIANGVSKASRASTNASVTEPDTPRYAQAVEFVDSQRDALQREAATGAGEHIDTLAMLLDTNQRSAGSTLGPWLQTHYSQVFNARADGHSVVDHILAERQS